jgi:hypothetical protein
MEGKNPANHILIYRSPKSQVDLFGNTRTSPGRIELFHFDDRPDQILRWTFWTGLGWVFWRKQQAILVLPQCAMIIQKRRGLERDGHPAKPVRLDPKLTESGDQPVQDLEIGCTSARTVQDQQLMFDQNGFRHDRAHTSGLDQPEKGRDEMDNENSFSGN